MNSRPQNRIPHPEEAKSSYYWNSQRYPYWRRRRWHRKDWHNTDWYNWYTPDNYWDNYYWNDYYFMQGKTQGPGPGTRAQSPRPGNADTHDHTIFHQGFNEGWASAMKYFGIGEEEEEEDYYPDTEEDHMAETGEYDPEPEPSPEPEPTENEHTNAHVKPMPESPQMPQRQLPRPPRR